ncbi:hypothetical protein IIA28_13270 [candidate division KSB1 bacterium]|nr:hypothetical protein [candidate division KSB1 bacterium]
MINKLKLPTISISLMIIFVVGGSIVLLLDWPMGPFHLDWGVWLLAYFGYFYLIAAALFYAKKGR